MIINLTSGGDGSFEFPCIYLDESKSWDLSVICYYGVLSKPVSKTKLLKLTSNIINRSSGNPTQIVGLGVIKAGHQVVHFQPTQLVKYKIRFPSIQSSVFTLEPLREDDNFKIIEASIQLEIRESYYDRF